MSNQSISQPAARTYPVVDLVAAAYEGRIRIPEFQRPLRWQWEDVRRLFDSIVKGYQIGNLLLWKRIAPEGVIRLGSLRIQSRAFDEGWWVVDGQQRLTSLANALSEEGAKDERFALAYDLGSPKGGFVRPSRDDDGFIVPLPVLFDLQRLIRWFNKEHPEAGEKLDEASRITRAIREYQVPTYLVNQDDEAVLRDIFDRMNNYGKRLRLAEVFPLSILVRTSAKCRFPNFKESPNLLTLTKALGGWTTIRYCEPCWRGVEAMLVVIFELSFRAALVNPVILGRKPPSRPIVRASLHWRGPWRSCKKTLAYLISLFSLIVTCWSC